MFYQRAPGNVQVVCELGGSQFLQPMRQPSASEDVAKLMQLYEKGSKSALKRLRKPLLAVLCAVKFGRNCDTMKKEELLDQIYEAVSLAFYL